MAQPRGLLGDGWSRVAHNKRYIFWFYVLNLTLAFLGAAAFGNQLHDYLDHSMQAERMLNGFDIGVVIEMFAQPEFGPMHAANVGGVHLALVFFFFTVCFVPGVLQGYGATYRLPREDFFRACGRNLWRFIRLLIVAGVVMGVAAGGLFALQGLIEKKAAESTNELLVPEVRLVGLIIIFLVMAALRAWFDLAQTDVVLSDRNAVRKSISLGFRHTWRNLGLLLGSYVVITIVALVTLLAGLCVWLKFVPPASVFGAVLVAQLTLLLLLIPRFWQRGVAVSYYLQNVVEPIVFIQPLTPAPAVVTAIDPVPAPGVSPVLPRPQES
jgi:hypothetical protein